MAAWWTTACATAIAVAYAGPVTSHRLSQCRAASLGLAVVLAALYVDLVAPTPSLSPADEPGPAAVAAAATAAHSDQADLVGVWSRYEGGVVGDPVRFYYFHDNGQGLYRYGRQGRSNTNSFDYTVDGTVLQLSFRKTGMRHETELVVDRDRQGRQWLRLTDDPREPGARYRKMPPVRGLGDCDSGGERQPGMAGDLEPSAAAVAVVGSDDTPVAGRIWIDHRNFHTGGAGFRMYQFNAAGIDGRGVGWFHEGDFDDWTTEALTYQLGPKSMRLWFLEREESEETSIHVGRDAKDHPVLTLYTDPRDFWHTHRYLDGGASFGLAAFAAVIGSVGGHPALRAGERAVDSLK